jgi:hypothetical protein
MKTKILCIFICTLLIAITIAPIVSAIGDKLPRSIIDQEQPNTGKIHWLDHTVPNWQQFVNQGNMLEEVELFIGCWYLGSADITLSIEETVGGTSLTSVTYQAADLPLDMQAWFTFDVPDVKLQRNKTYHIVLRFGVGSEYAWSGDNGDPYPAGDSSHPDIDWDYAFRTIVDKSKPININTFFLRFLENHPRMFPILRHLMGL